MKTVDFQKKRQFFFTPFDFDKNQFTPFKEIWKYKIL